VFGNVYTETYRSTYFVFSAKMMTPGYAAIAAPLVAIGAGLTLHTPPIRRFSPRRDADWESPDVAYSFEDGAWKTNLASEMEACRSTKTMRTRRMDLGHLDGFRGWYDVQGCGRCRDYCRWVDRAGSVGRSGGDPANYRISQTAYWSCRLAGTTDTDTEPGKFKMWEHRRCEGEDAVPPRDLLSKTLGSNMVLQRAPQRAVVWGFADPGVEVTTILDGVRSMNSTADALGVWRQTLPAMEGSDQAHNLEFRASSGATQSMTNVLFGDVYLCGGQSNMGSPVRIMDQALDEYRLAGDLPLIRVFTVGREISSDEPLADLAIVLYPWDLAKNAIEEFSAVCWVFGREVFKGLGGKVPIGLISSNKGGTAIERWSEPESLQSCNAAPWGDSVPETYSTLYNAMIYPFLVGPMTLTGFTWYQGEANVGHQFERHLQYACLFPALITSWRHKFRNPDAYFGFIQISTECHNRGGMAEFRSIAQLSGLQLPKVGYATNADHGRGCNPHPTEKQHCAARLAKSLLALQFGMNVAWKSPSFRSQEVFRNPPAMLVRLNDVSAEGLRNDQYPFNWLGGKFSCDGEPSTVVYEASGMVKRLHAPSVYNCAWASLLLNGTWVNATISVAEGGSALMLSAPAMYAGAGAPLASRYAWGNVPMMSVYDRETNLPVLPWSTLPILTEVLADAS